MSWCAYVLVLAARPDGLLATLALQAKLLVLTGAVFGQLPLLGLIANPLLVPLFPFLLAVGLAEALAGGFGASRLALAIHANFIEWTSAMAAIAERWPWLYVGSDQLGGLGRSGLVLVGAALVLNAVRDLSIRGYEIIREVPPCRSLGKANRSSSSTTRHPSVSSCDKPTKQ
jgi:predicted membrane metal-binding protein